MQKSNPDAPEFHHLMSETFEHLSNLIISALRQGDLEPGIIAFFQGHDAAGRRGFTVQHDPVGNSREAFGGRFATNLDVVRFGEAISGGGHTSSKLTVVGQ